MFSQTATSKFTKNYCVEINEVARYIKSADCVLIGIGAGMTAAGGLNYSDSRLAEKWYPEYYAMGLRSIIEIMSNYWPTSVENPERFWGFWAHHINHIRYEAETLKPYIDLYNIVKDKEYFICSTNVDGQLEKAGFPNEKIFAPQGDYALFQCEKPCSQDVYDNKNMIDKMLSGMVSPFEIGSEDIPRCPRCNSYLLPNLRCDNKFVEKPHMRNLVEYELFISEAKDKKLVLLELGVGFNTPGIIRYPFEQIAQIYSDAVLVRINREVDSVLQPLQSKTIFIRQDLLEILDKIRTFTLKT